MQHTMAAPVTPPEEAREGFAAFDKKAKQHERKKIGANGLHTT